MANLLALPNLAVSVATFRETYDLELVDLKRNANPVRTAAEANTRAVAQWANIIDGIALVLQADYAQRYVDALLQLGDGSVSWGEGPGPPDYEAELGSLRLLDDGTAWIKTDVGDTDWTEIGGGAPDPHAATHVTGGGDTIPSVVASGNAGLMTGADKAKLDGIEAGANVVALSDGSTTVDPLTLLSVDPSYFAVVDQGAGEGLVGLDPQAIVDDSIIDVAAIDRVLADIDLTAEADTALANGAFPIGGLAFVADDAGLAGAGSGLVAGTGLSIRAPTSAANTWSVASQAAPHLYLPAVDIPGFQPGVDTLIVDMHLGAASVFENGNDAIRMGLWGLANSPFAGAAARARIADKGNHGGVQTLRTFDGTTPTTTAIDFSGDNAYSAILFPDGQIILGTGDYSGGWPTRFNYFWRFGTLLTTDSFLGGEALRFVLIFINASDASPTSRGDVAHLRFRKP